MPSKKKMEPPSSPSSPSSSSSAGSRSPSPAPSKKRKPTTAPEDEIAVDLSAPEPPSKRARRALKKGKPLPKPASKKDDRADLEGASEDDADDGGGGGALPDQLKSASKKDRSKFGVWIGNLPFTATRADVFKWLVDSSGGSITEDAITRVNLPLSKDKKPGGGGGGGGSDRRENKGFAYVDFATFDACIAAVALSESEYGGRRLLIKDAKSFEGRPAPEKPAASAATTNGTTQAATAATTSSSSSSNTKKIYVGNLPFDATEDTLRWQFEKCGAIEWAKVATFEDSGKCKGYGWVRFADAAAADWAVKGFVKIKEAVETEEDFMSDNDNDDEDDNDNDGDNKGKEKDKDPAGSDADESRDEKNKKSRRRAEPKTKTRKWWVNKLKGRPLTIQLAEDDQTRYKKRFGKDKPKTPGAGPRRGRPDHSSSTTTTTSAAAVGGGAEEGGKTLSYHTDINVARLTGAAVAPQGKKVTFD